MFCNFFCKLYWSLAERNPWNFPELLEKKNYCVVNAWFSSKSIFFFDIKFSLNFIAMKFKNESLLADYWVFFWNAYNTLNWNQSKNCMLKQYDGFNYGLFFEKEYFAFNLFFRLPKYVKNVKIMLSIIFNRHKDFNIFTRIRGLCHFFWFNFGLEKWIIFEVI
jgi:hypothetical protein